MNKYIPELRDFSTLRQKGPELRDQPWPMLLDAPPVFWAMQDRCWIVHRHAEVTSVLTDRSFLVADLSSIVQDLCTRSGKPTPTLTGLLSAFLPFINPPQHEDARRFLRAVLPQGCLADHAAVLNRLSEDLLADVAKDRTFDAALRYADVLPSLFIAHVLGLPGPLVVDFVRETAEIGRTFDRGCSPRYYARMETLIIDQRLPFLSIVSERRKKPDDSAISRMILLADASYPLSDVDIANHVMFLIMAASENTAALIGNTIAAVVEAGLVDALVDAEPPILRAAVEETLRYAPPVRQMWRIAQTDLTLGGARISRGERLLLLTDAASRDPAVYPDPDRFDPWRSNRRGFGFGLGRHYCLGAELALLEAETALRVILQRLPRRVSDLPFEWHDRQTLRRALHLPLILSPQKGLAP